MIVNSSGNMVAEAEILCQQSGSVHYLRVSKPVNDDLGFLDVSPPSVSDSSFFRGPDAVSVDVSRSEPVVGCSTSTHVTVVGSAKATNYLPSVHSGSHTDIGPRRCNEDEHIRIDDLSSHLGSRYRWPVRSSFFAVFDGHGGPSASAFVKENAMRFFFEDANLPQASLIDNAFLEELEDCHRRAFLLADKALAVGHGIDSFCGTTALTALVLGRHLLVANAGDCRAVLCRKGVAVQISEDHRPSNSPERKRVEDLGGIIEYGYLNGELSVTRALGDWYMKGSPASPLTAEPEVQQILLTEDDEFLIIGCDGIWDVMSNQEAVSLVRHHLRLHNDPERCARELVNHALFRDTDDNLTAIVVGFISPQRGETVPSQGPRLRLCGLSEDARDKLRSVIEGS